MRSLALLVSICLLSACNTDTTETSSASEEEAAATVEIETQVEETKAPSLNLDFILDSVSEEHKARHQYRHPKATIEFFGIEPGMTVVEYLPGGGWYSQLLAPLIGSEGTLIGADYNMTLWPNFSWMNDAFMEERVAWPNTWTAKFAEWGGDNAAKPHATTIPEIGAEYENTVDAALFIRALHNLARFENKGGFLTEALDKTYKVLKPGGIVGVVQHEAREDKNDAWADGSAGYLKKSFVVERFKAAGFEFVAETSINQNELDQPGDQEVVWRLPPSYFNSGDDADKKAVFTKIGESNRMTLLFKKPS